MASFFFEVFLWYDESMSSKFDPTLLAIHSYGSESALPIERLSLSFLRDRFQQEIDWLPENTKESTLFNGDHFRPASVLLPLILRENGLHMLLTQRAAHLHHHGGQISFPGGRVDPDDISAEHTAVREAYEEIGLFEKQIELLGRLPQYFTGTGFCVTPVVAIVHPPYEFSADPVEVASIFEVPLAFLMNPDNHQLRELEMPETRDKRRFYAMPYEDYFIWGATAGILRNLFHFLRADKPE